MKVLVTGGAGFIGTNLIKQLLSDGHEVSSIDNYSTGLESNHQEGCSYYKHNIAYINHNTYNRFANPDVVFHLAAIARIQPSFKDPDEYIDVNFNGTHEIVKYCIKHNIPLIYAGSSSHHSGKFKNPYTFSKDLGEEIIKLYQEHFSLKASIARFYNVYGPYQLLEGGYTTLIGKWLNNIQNNNQCVIFGDGTKRRDFTHVEDIVNGLIKIMVWKEYGEVFEFGRGKNYSINDVATMFGITPSYKDDKLGEAQNTLADYSYAKYKLGWEPTKNLEDYIFEMRYL